MKLTYWIAECLDDSSAYSIRATTKRECTRLRNEIWNPDSFGLPKKVTVEYDNAFDLATQCLDEGGGWWESTS